LTFALYFALTCRAGRWRPGAAFFFLGAAVTTEYPVLPAAAAVATVAFFALGDAKRVLASAAWAAGPLALVALHNHLSFGHPWRLGYGALASTPFATGMSRGFFGVGLPSLPVALELLFGTYRGLFVYSPIVAVGLLALPAWPREERRRIALP